MSNQTWYPALLMLAITVAGSSPTVADTSVRDSATEQMRIAVVVARDGRHNLALRALRHLRDPALAPMFQRLAQTNHPAMRINGILGLAEISPDGQLTLEQIATVDDPTIQSEILTAALDDDLLPLDEASKLLGWQDVNEGVKLVVLLRMDSQARARYIDIIRQAANSELLGRRGLAALMLADLGDPQGKQILDDLNQSSSADLGIVQTQMLAVLANRPMRNVADWALDVAIRSQATPRLELLALREALRNGSQAAQDFWQKRFTGTSDPSDQTRLAIVALESADAVPASLYTPMIQNSDPVISQMGKAGAAVAGRSPQVAEQVVKLIEMDHPIANAWALRYAQNNADPQVREVVLMGLMLAAEQGDPRGLQRRLDLAVAAAEQLVKADLPRASQLLKPILSDKRANPMVLQALLYGVMRHRDPNVYQVVADLPSMRNPDARNLVLLLKARTNQPLNDRELRNLGFLVQGAGTIPDTFQLQAAWRYLKATGQADAALQQILSQQSTP